MQNLGREQRKEQIILPEMGQRGFCGIQKVNRLLKYDWELAEQKGDIAQSQAQRPQVEVDGLNPVCGWGRQEVELKTEWGQNINTPDGKSCQGHFGRVSIPHQLYKQGHMRRIPFEAGRLEPSGWGWSEGALALDFRYHKSRTLSTPVS